MRRALLLSSSALHGSSFMDWCSELVTDFLGSDVQRVLFVPYALFDYDEYTARVRQRLKPLGYAVDGIHELEDPVEAVLQAQAVYVGGGNTFRLLKTLYDQQLLEPIRRRVQAGELLYMGSSAGTNVATVSICTTNDMPIVYPPSFDALALLPFNINPHYQDPSSDSKHMGETREQRILQYLEYPDRPAVLGLREGSGLLLNGDQLQLQGRTAARLFRAGHEPSEHKPGADLSHLLKL